MMPLRGLERDNIAREIVPEDDKDREQHCVSFEFYPFHEGATYAVYKGLLSTEARRGGTFCVVKAFLDQRLDMTRLNSVVFVATEAQRLASKFNSIVGYEAVTFQQPSLARVQCVSDFVGLFRCLVPHEKRLKRNEIVVLEDFVEGAFMRFNSSNGTVPSEDSSTHQQQQQVKKQASKKSKPGRKINTRERIPKSLNDNSCSVGPNNLAQAFTHFTWHETNNLVVCDLKGVFSDNSYCLSNPTIHSLNSSFGPDDRGLPAISEVFASHRCTNICRDWTMFISPGSNSKNQVNFCDQSIRLRKITESPVSINTNICRHDNKLSK